MGEKKSCSNFISKLEPRIVFSTEIIILVKFKSFDPLGVVKLQSDLSEIHFCTTYSFIEIFYVYYKRIGQHEFVSAFFSQGYSFVKVLGEKKVLYYISKSELQNCLKY